VTEWWELAIPAGSTLAGGMVGSMMQARNSESQARREARTVERQRRVEMQRENQLQYFKERRQAYSDYCEAVYDVVAAGTDLEDARRRLANKPALEMRDRAVELRDRAFQGLSVAAQQLRTALVQVLLVGSHDLAPLSNRIADEVALVMQGRGNLDAIQDYLEKFLETARAELSASISSQISSQTSSE